MQQYFVKGQAEKIVVINDKEMIKYMFTVMRLQAGDEVILVFDDEIKRRARVLDVTARTFEVLEDLSSNVELPVQVTVAMGFPKGDKLEWICQKTTELGTHQIWAYPADWSVVKWDNKKLSKRHEKLTKVIQGAAEQSKRNHLPQLKLFEKKQDFLAEFADFDLILVAYEEAAKSGETASFAQALSQVKKGQKLLIIFGPEGGISPDELAKFLEKGAQTIGLGPRILRTETAPLYALSAISFYFELLANHE